MTESTEDLEYLHDLKPGSSFEFTYSLPLDFAATISNIYSQVRAPNGQLIETLTVTALPDTAELGNWKVSATFAQTAIWPLKDLRCDVLHVFTSGLHKHSSTFIIPVGREETKWPIS